MQKVPDGRGCTCHGGSPAHSDTFLTAVSPLSDELYQTELAPHRAAPPGRRPRLSDREVLTLIVGQHGVHRSARGVLRRVRCGWQHRFPTPRSQSALHRRVRGLS